ncbi:acyl carrier protein [Paenibacillus tundrae]|uniref:acyl carrier protein n=1 Tax=Paenibacillus tundrae TaxID=528187 RepID=UPI0022A987B8|nr:acyl carrier protein [Paenibacillus tundrae]MCZ1264753.1 acyl carrier protein [Paenibacillus tundrae]
MNNQEIYSLIIDKLVELRYVQADQHLNEMDNLIDLGLDSMGLITIIVEMEQATGVEVPDSELVINNFSNIHAFQQYFLG